MGWQPKGGWHGVTRPLMHHWLAAVTLLFGVTLIVPVLAGLT